MNTKTMRLPPRRVVTSSTNKRKEREGYDSPKPLPPHPIPQHNLVPAPPPLPTPARSHKPAGSARAGSDKPSNQLFAGYLAHEFLTQGTLLGKPWDPTRADSRAEPEPKRAKRSEEEESRRRYVEVSSLLRAGDGAHLPGIFNPTQLARFLQ